MFDDGTSKWILIEVFDNDIGEPEIFDSFEEAYDRMEEYYLDNYDESKERYTHYIDEYGEARISTGSSEMDWKIVEVPM